VQQIVNKGLFFNCRQPALRDIRVRKALTLLFDAKTMQRLYFHDRYFVFNHFFSAVSMQAKGLPDVRTRELLMPFKKDLSSEVFSESVDEEMDFKFKVRKALEFLKEAGWAMQAGLMQSIKTGEPLQFEIAYHIKDHEKHLVFYKQTLKRAGIEAHLSFLDPSRFVHKINEGQFDLAFKRIPLVLQRGDEQLMSWPSMFASVEGLSQVVTHLIQAMNQAVSMVDFQFLAQALDRVLIKSYVLLPDLTRDMEFVAYKKVLKHRPITHLRGSDLREWWSEKP
jgi:microcin C transport system substrate-binding protein